MLSWVIGLILVCIVSGAAAVRLAPSDPAVWHIDPRNAADPGRGGVLMRYETDVADPLSRFDDAIMAEARVTRLAGGVEDGQITYIARSKWVGFPDYISVAIDNGTLVILSRLRFGQGDLGVNAARLERVLQRI